MRADLYTKTVLTVIAAALLYICAALAPVATPVQAQLGPTQVVIAGWYDAAQQRVMPISTARGLPVADGASAGAGLVPPGKAVPLMASPTAGASAVAPRTAVPAQASSRCQATTQKGAQCSRSAKAGSTFCWQHGGGE